MGGVQLCSDRRRCPRSRWHSLRHEPFFSLRALNARIAAPLADLNARPMRLYRASRRALFERVDQRAPRPLSAERFVYGEWKLAARVNIDYHIELDGHYYSVPHPLVHARVDARLTGTTVEIFHRGHRVAAPIRSPSTDRRVHGRHRPIPALVARLLDIAGAAGLVVAGAPRRADPP